MCEENGSEVPFHPVSSSKRVPAVSIGLILQVSHDFEVVKTAIFCERAIKLALLLVLNDELSI